MSRRPAITETGDDPIDAITHEMRAGFEPLPSLFLALGNKVDALVPELAKLAKGIAEEKNVALIATLHNVRMYLERIEQLPNIDHAERGPLAREAMALIDKEIGT